MPPVAYATWAAGEARVRANVTMDVKVAFCYHGIMSQPVKLSTELVLDARQTGAVAERSIAGQIEFWARLGRAVEPLVSGDRALALRRAGDEQPLSKLVSSIDTAAGRRRVAEVLATRPFPHYEAATEQPGLLVRIEENGKRTLGRFIRGTFRAIPAGSRPASAVKPRRRRP